MAAQSPGDESPQKLLTRWIFARPFFSRGLFSRHVTHDGLRERGTACSLQCVPLQYSFDL